MAGVETSRFESGIQWFGLMSALTAAGYMVGESIHNPGVQDVPATAALTICIGASALAATFVDRVLHRPEN